MNFMPLLVRRRPGCVELAVSPLLRLVYVALGAVLVLFLGQSPGMQGFSWVFGVIIALGALSEDRWIFDSGSREVRHRFGLLLFAKSWAVDSGDVSSVELDADSAGMSPVDPYAAAPRLSSKAQSSIRLVFADGRSMTVCAAARKRLPELKERAEAIAGALGLPLVEA